MPGSRTLTGKQQAQRLVVVLSLIVCKLQDVYSWHVAPGIFPSRYGCLPFVFWSAVLAIPDRVPRPDNIAHGDIMLISMSSSAFEAAVLQTHAYQYLTGARRGGLQDAGGTQGLGQLLTVTKKHSSQGTVPDFLHHKSGFWPVLLQHGAGGLEMDSRYFCWVPPTASMASMLSSASVVFSGSRAQSESMTFSASTTSTLFTESVSSSKSMICRGM